MAHVRWETIFFQISLRSKILFAQNITVSNAMSDLIGFKKSLTYKIAIYFQGLVFCRGYFVTDRLYFQVVKLQHNQARCDFTSLHTESELNNSA